MRLQDCPNPKGRKMLLIILTAEQERELRENHRKVPKPGDQGICEDFELADKRILFNDMLLVRFENGECYWLPAYCWRVI